ncbi:MAG: LytTR family DNA-binding domain-containing protein [Candidatus Binatus sp.]|uniref:LytR/AlgR family response regulator transcription factor n=1 Tax=Candidatus Binatus sp. TaxID=2811406 RepID=UPI00271AE70B|nr:LytTR family DNA-binding domain-containing protein [Candidatus Binatus sp.]MDO8434514.1 LytTR family DNA-binding domain-containing protein [Candidatus Binatus sp.]
MHEAQAKNQLRKIRALIVEDEAPARSRIIRFLKAHNDVEIVGEAATGYEAIALIERTSPNLLVLDIKLPDISGLEVLKSLGDRPHVIFSTAYDSYAIEAFEVEAVDFLLKPYEQRRVDTALERVRAKIQSEQPPLNLEDLLRRIGGGGSSAHRIALHDREHIVLASAGEIFYFIAEGDDVYARLRSRRLAVRRSLRELEQLMEPRRFFRANRSTLVNLDLVREIHPWFGGRFVVRFSQLEPSEQIEVSRRQARLLSEMLS